MGKKKNTPEKKREWSDVNEQVKFVCRGGKVQCPFAMPPIATIIPTANDVMLQDKPFATTGDNDGKVNLNFTGVCNHPSQQKPSSPPPPCKAVISLGKWKNYSDTKINDDNALLVKSTIQCMISGQDLKIVHSGQIAVLADISPLMRPDSIQKIEINNIVDDAIPFNKNDTNMQTCVSVPQDTVSLSDVSNSEEQNVVEEVPTTPVEEEKKVLNAYFAKWISEKNSSSETVTLEEIDERGLSYIAALVIETEGLSGKKLKVKIKTGKRKVLTDLDMPIEFIDYNDILDSDAAGYKNIKPKSEYEIEVDNLVDSSLYSNAEDFKNKAVLRLMLNQRTDDLSFDMAELINSDADKTAFVYVEISTTEPNVKFYGQGDEGKKFLSEEGAYFEIKYLEQPWIVKARKEQTDNINETSNSDRVIEYHNINRQYKPATSGNNGGAWCASFVGWCLSESGYSAQLDAGAYSYGRVNTRYRAGYKKTPTDTNVLEAEVFDDPVWGQKTTNNKLALGATCVVSGSHVTFAVAMNKDNTHVFGLGGNQGDRVRVSAYRKGSVQSSVFPIEYTINDNDYELPIYFRELTTESTN